MKGLFKDTLLDEQFERIKKINQLQMWFDSIDRKDTKDFIVSLITIGQLYSRGIDENERIIGRYSELTEEINPEKIAGTPYTLKDTGAFYKSIHVIPSPEGFVVDGDGLKTGMKRLEDSVVESITNLFEVYGDGIVGLTDYNKEQLGEFLIPKFIEYVKSIL